MGGEAEVLRDDYSKSWLIWPTLMLVVIGTVAAVGLFAWPKDSPGRTRFDVGSVGSFDIGSVTTVDEGAFHLVRLSDETFIALSSRDSHLRECVVNWEPDLVWPPRPGGGSLGWFRAYCSGTVFDKTGQREFGPSPRDLDRYSVSIVDDRVLVNTERFICGVAPPGAACDKPSSPP